MKYFCLLLICLFFSAQASWDPFESNGVFINQDAHGVDLQCENIPLSTVIQTLAEQLEFNVLLTTPLSQPVTMQIRGVTRKEIFYNLLEAYALHAVQKNEILIILPHQSLESPKRVKTFILKYTSAEILSETLKSRLQTGFDSRTNALIVYNEDQDLSWVETLIRELDVPAKQVYIEATIMNANTQFSKELGLRYEVENFSITTLPRDLPIQVALAAGQEKHQTQIIANPKLLTVNLQEAHIKQGKQVAYQETLSNGATNLNFQEAALELRVRPMITPENEILLDLLVKQDVLGSISVNGQPTIDTKAIQAKVRVKDGETIVLGGIYSQIDNQRGWALPVLGSIPLIGLLFQQNHSLDDQDELLIFVTPRVVD